MPKGESKKSYLQEIQYVKTVTIGSINPNVPFSDKSRGRQENFLNRCLSGHPKGIILSKDVAVGCFQAGEHSFTLERTPYHVGFRRKPGWLTDESGGEKA